MASCRACGVDITHAKTREGENVPLETYMDTGVPNRYRVVEFAQPLTVERVPDDSPVSAYPDHRNECPDYGNGLVR